MSLSYNRQGSLSPERTSPNAGKAVDLGDNDSSLFRCSWCPANGWTYAVKHKCLPARFHSSEPLPLLNF